MTHCVSDCNNVNGQSMKMTGYVEGAQISHCDIVNSLGAGSIQANLLIVHDSVQNNFFGPNLFLDSHGYGLYANAGYGNDFIGCWFTSLSDCPLPIAPA